MIEGSWAAVAVEAAESWHRELPYDVTVFTDESWVVVRMPGDMADTYAHHLAVAYRVNGAAHLSDHMPPDSPATDERVFAEALYDASVAVGHRCRVGGLHLEPVSEPVSGAGDEGAGA